MKIIRVFLTVAFASLLFTNCDNEIVQSCQYVDGNITMCFETDKDEDDIEKVKQVCTEKSGDFADGKSCAADGKIGACTNVALGTVSGTDLGSTGYEFYAPTPVSDAKFYCAETLKGNYVPLE